MSAFLNLSAGELEEALIPERKTREKAPFTPRSRSLSFPKRRQAPRLSDQESCHQALPSLSRLTYLFWSHSLSSGAASGRK